MAIVLFYLLLIVYFVICLFLVLVVLGQEGKGGGLSGLGSATLGETFGFGGAETAMRKWTRNIAIMFFVLTIALTFLGERIAGSRFERALLGDTTADQAAPQTVPAEQINVQPQAIQGTPMALPGGTPAAGAPATGTAPASTPAAAATPAATPAGTPAPAPTQ